MRQLANTKLNEDVVVPLRKQVELVGFVNELRVGHDLRIGTFGHCGDGNLHVNFMYDREDAAEAERLVDARAGLTKPYKYIDPVVVGAAVRRPLLERESGTVRWDHFAMAELAKRSGLP